MTIFSRFLLIAGIVLLAACEQPAAVKDEVAVLDLNEVARVTEQDVAIREQVDGARNELTEQLRSLLAQLETELAAEREKLGSRPSDAELERVQMLTMQAQQQMGEAQAQAQTQSAQFEAQLAQEFRGKLLPLAQAEAEARGANIVLARDAYLFWSEDTIDITDAVIAAWNALPAEEEQADAGSAEAESGAGEAAEAPVIPAASDTGSAEPSEAAPAEAEPSEATPAEAEPSEATPAEVSDAALVAPTEVPAGEAPAGEAE